MKMAVCPVCLTNGPFVEFNITPGFAEIRPAVDASGQVAVNESGQVEIEYCGDTEMMWNDQRRDPEMAKAPFHCRACEADFAEFKIVEIPDVPKPDNTKKAVCPGCDSEGPFYRAWLVPYEVEFMPQVLSDKTVQTLRRAASEIDPDAVVEDPSRAAMPFQCQACMLKFSQFKIIERGA